jgi:AcrR family transcriptional regulator
MALKALIKHPGSARAAVARRPRRRRSPGRPAASDLSVGADAIVLKACELLREVTPRELSLVKLARYAAVDRSLIRYYFTDRSGLLLAAARHLFGVLRGRLDAVETRLASDPEKRISEMAVALLEFQIEHPYFHRLMIDEVVNSTRAEAQAFFRTFTAQGVQSFRDMAAATVRRGQARPHEGVFLYLALIGMCEFFVTGAAILRVAFGDDYDLAGINRQYAQFLRDYVIDGIRKR